MRAGMGMESREIEERAGTWLAKRESGNWTAEDEVLLTRWLDASIANRVAFLRQEAAWEQALRLQALKGHTTPGTVPSPENWRLTPFVSDGPAYRSETAHTGTVPSRRRWI